MLHRERSIQCSTFRCCQTRLNLHPLHAAPLQPLKPVVQNQRPIGRCGGNGSGLGNARCLQTPSWRCRSCSGMPHGAMAGSHGTPSNMDAARGNACSSVSSIDVDSGICCCHSPNAYASGCSSSSSFIATPGPVAESGQPACSNPLQSAQGAIDKQLLHQCAEPSVALGITSSRTQQSPPGAAESQAGAQATIVQAGEPDSSLEASQQQPSAESSSRQVSESFLFKVHV